MASGTNPKVRFVKCPRCLRVLLEDEDVPVYQCGGCFTILQAKKRNISTNGTPSLTDAGGIQPSESQRVLNVEASTSSSPDMNVPSSGEFSTVQKHENGQNGSVDSIDEQLSGIKLSKGEQTDDIQSLVTSAVDPLKNQGGEISILEADTDVVHAEQGFYSGRSSIDQVAAAARETTLSVDGSPGQRAESSPEILTSSPDEDGHGHGNDYRGHPHGESTDDLQSGDFLANKTFSAYDGSVSSSDGREDQPQDSQTGLFANVDDRLHLEERARGKSVMQDHSESKEDGTSSSSMTPEEKHKGTKHKKLDQNIFLRLEGSEDRLDRHWRRRGTQEFQSYIPYYRKGPSFSSAYEHGNPSYPSHDDFDSHSRAYSLQMPPYAGHRHSGPGLDRMYHDFSYGINPSARGWSQTNRASRIPFSGESVMNRRHHQGQPSWYQGQLHATYGSYPGSPQRHMEPEYQPRWSRELVSDVEDQHRHGRHEVQTYLREKKPVAKRHVHPTAGGAPYISCYHCSQTLQMPADFLIFKRKYHFLRCGTCMNVLRFSLQDRTHLVPVMKEAQPKSSRDIDDHGDGNSVTKSSRNEVPKPEKRSSSAKNDELPVARGSPLHRLMGYSTVSQIFKVSQRPPSPRISDSDQMSKN